MLAMHNKDEIRFSVEVVNVHDSGCNGSDLANLGDRSVILSEADTPTRHITFFVSLP